MTVTRLMFCAGHSKKMQEALDARGLLPLVSADIGEGLRRMIDAAVTGTRADNFDPYMVVHNAVLFNAVNVLGPIAFEADDDGETRCPLCLLSETHKQECGDPNCQADFDCWIDMAADDAKEYLDAIMQGKPS